MPCFMVQAKVGSGQANTKNQNKSFHVDEAERVLWETQYIPPSFLCKIYVGFLGTIKKVLYDILE